MEQDDPTEALTELRERRLGALELLQVAAGSGLAAYAVWALLLQPGFRRVPLRLQVPYVGASARQVENVLSLMRGRPGKMVDLGSGDGRIVLAAHRCGLHPAVGYELNPWLVGLARLHAWRAGYASNVRYLREDLWKGFLPAGEPEGLLQRVCVPGSQRAPNAGGQAAGGAARGSPRGVWALPPPHLGARGCGG
ncbi:adenine nucleotide translocase lysine N-methyltransferase isoform 2-T2 [Trichechus inunguis]